MLSSKRQGFGDAAAGRMQHAAEGAHLAAFILGQVEAAARASNSRMPWRGWLGPFTSVLYQRHVVRATVGRGLVPLRPPHGVVADRH